MGFASVGSGDFFGSYGAVREEEVVVLDDLFDDSDSVEFFYDRVVKETDAALLLETHLGDIWIPKSQIIERYEDEDGHHKAVIPVWLAVEKGLV